MTKYKLPTIKEMLDSGVHFGHQIKRWHPAMERYIYTVNKNIHIIDLEQTEKLLAEACEFLYDTASKGKVIIFVGTKRQSKDIIGFEAKRCGAMYVSERWVGGTITNFETIKKNLDKLLDLLKGRQEGRFDKRTKKERLLIDREIEKLQIMYGGIVNLKSTPDVLFVIDPKREKTAVREALRAGLPIVSLIDTNADPAGISYPIPGNDDAIKSVALIVKAVADAVEKGYKEFGKSRDADDKEEADSKTEKVAKIETIEKTKDLPAQAGESIEKEVELVEGAFANLPAQAGASATQKDEIKEEDKNSEDKVEDKKKKES